ncbi:MAG TPA: zinc ribbon domain-containing protein [Candidatus Acidoferrales bacterium]|nr:zinc ribbon domain-containing protein [Candidatus Acidoferrales bacterium]
MTCPKCGAENAQGVQFCTTCHATLVFKCPKCEHTQSHGGVCDACGLNMTAFWAVYLETKSEEDQKIAHDKTMAVIHNVAAVATAPIGGARGISQFFLAPLLERLFARFRSR